jgi:hypothetical protein
MKNVKNFLRVWIAGASVAGFIFGWATFAHANKPVTLPIVQSLSPTSSTTSSSTSAQTSIQGLQSIPQSRFSTSPRLRTGGS